MSRRKISNSRRRSTLNLNDTGTVIADETEWAGRLRQSSRFFSSSVEIHDDTDQFMLESSDKTGNLEPQWYKRIRKTSNIGNFNEDINIKESTFKANNSTDSRFEDKTVNLSKVIKRKRAKRLQMNSDTSSDTDVNFDQILSGQYVSSQQSNKSFNKVKKNNRKSSSKIMEEKKDISENLKSSDTDDIAQVLQDKLRKKTKYKNFILNSESSSEQNFEDLITKSIIYRTRDSSLESKNNSLKNDELNDNASVKLNNNKTVEMSRSNSENIAIDPDNQLSVKSISKDSFSQKDKYSPESNSSPLVNKSSNLNTGNLNKSINRTLDDSSIKENQSNNKYPETITNANESAVESDEDENSEIDIGSDGNIYSFNSKNIGLTQNSGLIKNVSSDSSISQSLQNSKIIETFGKKSKIDKEITPKRHSLRLLLKSKDSNLDNSSNNNSTRSTKALNNSKRNSYISKNDNMKLNDDNSPERDQSTVSITNVNRSANKYSKNSKIVNVTNKYMNADKFENLDKNQSLQSNRKESESNSLIESTELKYSSSNSESDEFEEKNHSAKNSLVPQKINTSNSVTSKQNNSIRDQENQSLNFSQDTNEASKLNLIGKRKKTTSSKVNFKPSEDEIESHNSTVLTKEISESISLDHLKDNTDPHNTITRLQTNIKKQHSSLRTRFIINNNKSDSEFSERNNEKQSAEHLSPIVSKTIITSVDGKAVDSEEEYEDIDNIPLSESFMKRSSIKIIERKELGNEDVVEQNERKLNLENNISMFNLPKNTIKLNHVETDSESDEDDKENGNVKKISNPISNSIASLLDEDLITSKKSQTSTRKSNQMLYSKRQLFTDTDLNAIDLVAEENSKISINSSKSTKSSTTSLPFKETDFKNDKEKTNKLNSLIEKQRDKSSKTSSLLKISKSKSLPSKSTTSESESEESTNSSLHNPSITNRIITSPSKSTTEVFKLPEIPDTEINSPIHEDSIQTKTQTFSNKTDTKPTRTQNLKTKSPKLILKPVQTTIDDFLEKMKRSAEPKELPPSKLGLKYQSLQHFDKKHGPFKNLSKELQDLRMELLKDDYVMQETKRIRQEEAKEEEKLQEETRKKKEVVELQKRKEREVMIKKKAEKERKRKKEERDAQVPEAFKVNGKVYKPPSLFRPQKWCTKHLYKYLQTKMEPIYGLSTRIKSEKLVKNLVDGVNFITKAKKYDDYKVLLEKLKRMLARNGIIITHEDFYFFCREFLPYDFRVKATPIMLPGNKLTIPNYDPSKDNSPILES